MNLLAFPFRTKTPQQVVNNSWDDRNSILKDDVNLFCWKRPVDRAISSYLEQLLEKELNPIQFHADLENLDRHIEQARLKWDQNPTQAADLFWEDVSRLAFDFLLLTESAAGTIHLKVIDNNACTKFHIDGYSLRLFTTYYGLGTEWLPEKATNRRGLGKTNKLIVKNPKLVNRMDPFEVGILKGEIANRPPMTKGIVHRSPEISHTGEKRIILRVDV